MTTNLNINFMRKPEPGDLIGEGALMKLGKILAVGDFTIWSDGKLDPVAACHADLCNPRLLQRVKMRGKIIPLL